MRAAIVGVFLCVFLSLGLKVAHAQQQPKPAQAELAPGQLEVGPVSGAAAKPPVDRDRTSSSGGAMALLFWGFALVAVGGSVFVITRRNLIAAVMGMVGTFFGVAALYMLLYAQFLAVIQMLVYAGAIMVLFVFVVMILNKPEDEPWGLVGLPGKALAGLAMVYLTFRLGQTLWGVKPPDAALAAPEPVQVQFGMKVAMQDGKPVFDQAGHKTYVPDMRAVDWGSTGAVGDNLFDEYLFPFEAVSILLLVAVVGAIAVARPLHHPQDEDETSPAAEEAA